MSALIDDDLVFLSVPRCNECDDEEGVRPAMHTYYGPYFCIHCCNYLDESGAAVN